MKLTSLKIKRAYGYLDLHLRFDKTLSFLVGINGSGKTTALRLLEALLTPSLQLLDSVPHDQVELRLRDSKNKAVKIISVVTEDKTTLRVLRSGAIDELVYLRPAQTTPRPQNSSEDHESYSAIYAQHADNPVLRFLQKELDTPLFLGLERRNVALHFDEGDNSLESRRREMFLHSMRRRMPVTGQLGMGLLEVQFLIQEIFRRSRGEQELFTKQLREDIFLDAFNFQPGAGFFKALHQGTTANQFLEQIKKKRKDIEKALSDAGLAPNAFAPVLDRFFNHIADLSQKSSKKNFSKDRDLAVELAFNRPVVDRVLKLIDSSEKYNAKLQKLWTPINEFLELVNRFLIDSEKKLEIDEVGWLNVCVQHDKKRSLDILSSGERQIVVILGHLAITKELNRAGIFIVDEPELSLHLKWQEIFVDSLLKASPNNQFILATHSPAIVLDRDENCVSLDQRIGRNKK